MLAPIKSSISVKPRVRADAPSHDPPARSIHPAPGVPLAVDGWRSKAPFARSARCAALPGALSVSDSVGAGGAAAAAASQPPRASGPTPGRLEPARKRATHLTCTPSSLSSVTKEPAGCLLVPRRPQRSGPRRCSAQGPRAERRPRPGRPHGCQARRAACGYELAQYGSTRSRSATWRTARSASMLLSSRAPARDTLTTQNVTAAIVRSRSPPRSPPPAA